MADANGFYRSLASAANETVVLLQRLETLKDRLDSDAGLAAAAATAAQASGRSDLVTADFTNAADAITQLLFTWNSGTPTQKAAFYKLL